MSKRSRKRKFAVEDKAMFEWEKDRILPENLRDEMESMWELPQIYHFLQLTKEVLNISHLSMYEVERMLLMPKASKQLAHIMTCLLSSPSTTRTKQQKVPPMPYEFWTNILSYKLRSWFKMYQTKRQDSLKVFDTLGVEPEFWSIFPDANEIEGKEFQDFSFKQRVWLLKTICDTAMHSRKTIQDEMAKQPWESQFETVLGIDRYGARYIYFPQFLHNDLRVYKHCLDNTVLSTVKAPIEEIKPKVEVIIKQEPKVTPRFPVKKKKRRSRWSNGSLPTKKKDRKKVELPLIDQSIFDSNSNSVDAHFGNNSRSSSKASEISCGSFAKSSGYETNISGDLTIDKVVNHTNDIKNTNEPDNSTSKAEEDVNSNDKKTEDSMAVDDLDTSAINYLKNEDACPKESSVSTLDDLSKSSKTDDEKLEEISSMNASKVSEKPGETDVQLFSSLAKDVNISKSDDEKLSENKKCDNSMDNEFLNDEESLDKWLNLRTKDRNTNDSLSNSDDDDLSDSALSNSTARRSARIKNISDIKLEVEGVENLVNVQESEELSSIELRDSLCRVSSPEIDDDYFNEDFNGNKWKVDDFNKLISDLSVSNFQLVADSVDSLKDLTEFISSDKTIVNETKKESFVRPKCEETLLKRMKVLCTSLENVEAILKESTKRARNKLQREWNNFENGVVEEDRDTEEGANRWVLNSQGCTVPTEPTFDIPRATISRTGTGEPSKEENSRPSSSDSTQVADQGSNAFETPSYQESQDNKTEQLHTTKTVECKTEENKAGDKSESKDISQESHPSEAENLEDECPKRPTRVLRARGVSSYTEQLFSDDESEEEKLDGWTDIEAIYATPSSQISTSTPNTPSKTRESSYYSQGEDSDQDWILPSSRKRKNKRPSANRRLKSFQHKLQNIKLDQDNNGLVKGNHSSNNLSYNNFNHTGTQLNKIAIQPIDKIIVPSTNVKVEPQDSKLHSVLDIKDEGPIYEPTPSNPEISNCLQQNYVVVTTGHAPVANYYVMQQNAPITGVMQPNQFIQPTTFVSQMPQGPSIQQVQPVSAEGYYVHPNPTQNYIVQNQPGLIATTAPRQSFITAANSQVVYQPAHQGYLQYVTQPQQPIQQPRIINTMTLTPPRQIAYRSRAPAPNRMPISPRQNFPHPNGAVIRSAPIAPNVLRPGQRVGQQKNVVARRQVRQTAPTNVATQATKTVQTNTSTNTVKNSKATSLIVLSDSDDDIEMIVSEKKDDKQATPSKSKPQAIAPKGKIALPPQLMQRMSEGGISISPIKPAQPAISTVNQNTQLVVVVNETGSHYALALPNGSKLILTPEQVAQIRASNGGKLVL